jgi:hypothetical protein
LAIISITESHRKIESKKGWSPRRTLAADPEHHDKELLIVTCSLTGDLFLHPPGGHPYVLPLKALILQFEFLWKKATLSRVYSAPYQSAVQCPVSTGPS